jgi:hypothetical protein
MEENNQSRLITINLQIEKHPLDAFFITYKIAALIITK